MYYLHYSEDYVIIRFVKKIMRDCVMVALMTLDHSVRVQILLPQPNKNYDFNTMRSP